MSLPRYPEYKDCGVEWLGEVPGHWEVKRLRFVAELNPSKSEIAELDKGTQVSFLPMDAIGDDGKLNLEYEKQIAEVETGYTFFRDGDVTVAKITPCFENGKGAVMRGLTQGIGFGTTELIVARPITSQTCSDYLHALFTSVEFRKNGEGHMYGAGGQKRVPDDFVRNFAIAFPPVEEQQTIAAFLDHETGKIDALIAEQRRLVELLAEKRQAVISHAVTKGLNPNAKMKNSGIEWLGEVPEHWEVGALGYLGSINTGATPDRGTASFWNGDIPWLKTGEIAWKPITEAEEFITEEAVERTAVKLSPPGTMLMAMYGQGVTRGRVALLKIDATYNQACAAISFGTRIKPEFAVFFFMSAYDYIRDSGNETSQMNLNAEVVSKFKMTIPPLEEQIAIAAFLDTETAKFDTLTTEANRAIALLQERRSALISAAVTGKIDVRSNAAC